MNAVAIIAATLPLVERLVAYVQRLRAVARQAGELSAAEDAALDARIAALGRPETKPDHWKTDAELGE